MNRGRWTIVAIVLVAIVLGLATWPLLKIRRQREIRRTQGLLKHLDSLCRQYQSEYRRPPPTLAALKSDSPLVDAWHRALEFTLNPDGKSWTIRSRGPNEEDPGDDLTVPLR